MSLSSNAPPILIIGAGHAGVDCAFALRLAGVTGDIVVIGNEAHMPYERPPLSKAILSSTLDIERVQLKPQAAFDKARIHLRLGMPVTRLDPGSHTVHLADGTTLDYRACILATGARARPLPGLDADHFHTLRTLDDAMRLQSQLIAGRRLVIIGAGYLGLEVATTAASLGLQVTVLESGQLMGGKVSPHTEARFADMHREAGVTLLTGVAVTHCEHRVGQDSPWRVALADGSEHAADLLLVAIGALPNIDLAAAAGITCADGIEVDAHCATSAPGVFAVGDCANAHSPHGQRRCRIESVQNALYQARTVAAVLAGGTTSPLRPPTFWSEQCGKRLQMAGLVHADVPIDDRVISTARGWVVERYQHGQLRAVEAVDSPVDFIQATRLIAAPSVTAPSVTAPLFPEPQHA